MHLAKPINPQRVAWELSPRLPERAIITSDSGSCANWYARDLKIRRGMMCSLSGGLASMGAAVPYAIAAKFAHPDRPVIALVGDGAMQMNNMAELITVAKYWRSGRSAAGSFASSTTRISTRSPGSSGSWKAIRNSSLAAHSQCPLPPICRADRAARESTSMIPSVGPAWEEALAGRSARRARSQDRSRGATTAPAHHPQTSQGFTSTLLKGDPEEGGVIAGTARQVLSVDPPGKSDK